MTHICSCTKDFRCRAYLTSFKGYANDNNSYNVVHQSIAWAPKLFNKTCSPSRAQTLMMAYGHGICSSVFLAPLFLPFGLQIGQGERANAYLTVVNMETVHYCLLFICMPLLSSAEQHFCWADWFAANVHLLLKTHTHMQQ